MKPVCAIRLLLILIIYSERLFESFPFSFLSDPSGLHHVAINDAGGKFFELKINGMDFYHPV